MSDETYPPMIRIQSGDRVLITVGRHATKEQVDVLLTGIRERFPDVEVMVLAGIESVIVQSPESGE